MYILYTYTNIYVVSVSNIITSINIGILGIFSSFHHYYEKWIVAIIYTNIAHVVIGSKGQYCFEI